jgi:hypothetical protein
MSEDGPLTLQDSPGLHPDLKALVLAKKNNPEQN